MSYPRLTNLYEGAGRTVLIILRSQPRSWTLQPSQDVSLGCGLDRVSTFSWWTAIRVAPYGGRRPRCRGQFFALGALRLAPQVVASNPKPWPLCTAAEFARRRYTPSLRLRKSPDQKGGVTIVYDGDRNRVSKTGNATTSFRSFSAEKFLGAIRGH
jgi:hypothetical protein